MRHVSFEVAFVLKVSRGDVELAEIDFFSRHCVIILLILVKFAFAQSAGVDFTPELTSFDESADGLLLLLTEYLKNDIEVLVKRSV